MRLLYFLLVLTTFAFCVQITPPELPRVKYDVSYSAPTNKIVVSAGQSIQAAIDNAILGTLIELEAGATWDIGKESIILKNKSGDGWIYVQSSSYNSLPPPGTRVAPSDSQYMPKIISDVQPAITIEKGAHHYRLVGIEFTGTTAYMNALIELGNYYPSSMADLADHIVLDRIYAWGPDDGEIKRGVALNCISGAIVDSYLSGFKAAGFDSQAAAGWIGTGPYVIDNNFMEGATENFIFGGADPPATLNSPIPSDVFFTRNHLFKRLSWLGDNSVVVKNLLEFKVGQRILVEGNVFENNWANAQAGRAIVLTPRNQDGTMPTAVVSDITLRNNIVHTSCAGLIILGRDDLKQSLVTERIDFSNNLIYNLSPAMCGGGSGRGFLFISGPEPGNDWSINHNSIIPEIGADYNSWANVGDSGTVVNRFQLNDNVAYLGSYAIHAAQGTGNQAMQIYMSEWEMKNNLLVGPEAFAVYFPNDTIVNNGTFMEDVANDNFAYVSGSPYLGKASDGTNPGADLEKIACAINLMDVPAKLKLPECTSAPTAYVPKAPSSIAPATPKSVVSVSAPIVVVGVAIYLVFILTILT